MARGQHDEQRILGVLPWTVGSPSATETSGLCSLQRVMVWRPAHYPAKGEDMVIAVIAYRRRRQPKFHPCRVGRSALCESRRRHPGGTVLPQERSRQARGGKQLGDGGGVCHDKAIDPLRRDRVPHRQGRSHFDQLCEGEPISTKLREKKVSFATEHNETSDVALQRKMRSTRCRLPRRRSAMPTSEESCAGAPTPDAGATSGAERPAIASSSADKIDVPAEKNREQLGPSVLQVWQMGRLAARPQRQVQECAFEHQAVRAAAPLRVHLEVLATGPSRCSA